MVRHRGRRFATARWRRSRRPEAAMSATRLDTPPRYLRTPEAARFLGLSGRTLEKHRTYGTGPVYRKLGGRIVYALDDLQVWADRGTRLSTSDPGHDVVHPAKPHARLTQATPARRGGGAS
jgi:predicted DNA-binding transcriptional regulator AlpA